MEDETTQPKSDTVKNRRNYPSKIQRRPPFKGEVPPNKKYCPECEKILDIKAFTAHTGKVRSYCILCTNKLARLSYHKDRQAYERDRMMRRNYNGFSSEQYNVLLEAQKGVCAVCGRPEMTLEPRTKKLKYLQVDHCHKTGKVRALLCQGCNNALGHMKNDPKRIQALLRYAEKHCLSNEVPDKELDIS